MSMRKSWRGIPDPAGRRRTALSAVISLADEGRRGDSAANNFRPKCEERSMDFNMSDRQREWLNRVESFMHKHVRPAVPIYKQQDAEGERWKVIPILEDLTKKAKAEGLWNMFMPPNAHEDDEFRGAGLSNLEYAPPPEERAHTTWPPKVLTCA